jgi:hypothetical protein
MEAICLHHNHWETLHMTRPLQELLGEQGELPEVYIPRRGFTPTPQPTRVFGRRDPNLLTTAAIKIEIGRLSALAANLDQSQRAGRVSHRVITDRISDLRHRLAGLEMRDTVREWTGSGRQS